MLGPSDKQLDKLNINIENLVEQVKILNILLEEEIEYRKEFNQ